jgi:hypothetical protein
MDFQISALDPQPFSHLFAQDTESLAAQGIQRMTVDAKPGYPCRVSLAEGEVGETVLLLNYEHQSASTPYRSSYAIFVREGAEMAHPAVNEVPESLRLRLLSLRAFSDDGMLQAAEVVHGREIETVLHEMLADDSVSYVHIHNAKPGCFAARADRVRTSN